MIIAPSIYYDKSKELNLKDFDKKTFTLLGNNSFGGSVYKMQNKFNKKWYAVK